jgi:hypothetical protein
VDHVNGLVEPALKSRREPRSRRADAVNPPAEHTDWIVSPFAALKLPVEIGRMNREHCS